MNTITKAAQAALRDLADWHWSQATTLRKAARTTAIDKPEPSRSSLLRMADWHEEQKQLLAALQDKAGEVTVAIDNLYNKHRDGMTNAVFPPVQIGTRLFAAHPAPVVPDGFALVPVEFVRGFCTLAHNYQLKAEAPSYYRGIEADAFSAAYRRCGEDLAKVRTMLAASQQN